MIPGSPVVLVNEQEAAGPRTGDAANLRKPGPSLLLFLGFPCGRAVPWGSILQPLNGLLICVGIGGSEKGPQSGREPSCPVHSPQSATRMVPFSMCAKAGKRRKSTALNKARGELQSLLQMTA